MENSFFISGRLSGYSGYPSFVSSDGIGILLIACSFFLKFKSAQGSFRSVTLLLTSDLERFLLNPLLYSMYSSIWSSMDNGVFTNSPGLTLNTSAIFRIVSKDGLVCSPLYSLLIMLKLNPDLLARAFWVNPAFFLYFFRFSFSAISITSLNLSFTVILFYEYAQGFPFGMQNLFDSILYFLKDVFFCLL